MTLNVCACLMIQDLEKNKRSAINFYQLAFQGDPKTAVEKYVGNDYKQHNPTVSDGKQGFIDYFERMQKEFESKSIEFLRVIAENDLVALHTRQKWPGDEEYVTMDFFRFDEFGKIIEHWDSIQQVPETSLNQNSMF